jgi:pimeloyl-ACP methyl ester carboxylesterase
MNTCLAAAEEPLPAGFIQWRAMCRDRPDISIARLFARGNPHRSEAGCAAHDAPFPTAAYRAATRAIPEMLPEHPGDDGVEVSRRTATFWAHEWTGRSMMAAGVQDPVFTPERMERLPLRIRGCPALLLIAEGGHFVQEHGAFIADQALRVLE